MGVLGPGGPPKDSFSHFSQKTRVFRSVLLDFVVICDGCGCPRGKSMRIYALLAFRFTECMHFYAISEGWEIGPKSPFTCPTACLARPAKQILSLFTLFRASFAIFCKACKADFVAIYAIPVLFCHIWSSLQSIFCRYVRYSGPLLP